MFHCVVHRESLAVADASKKILQLLYVEKISNKVYLWVQNSPKRSNELKDLLKFMQINVLDVTLNEMVIEGRSYYKYCEAYATNFNFVEEWKKNFIMV